MCVLIQVKKAEVFYWKVNDLDKFSCKNFPIFGGEGESACAYGMPVFEYPGLMKVKYRQLHRINIITCVYRYAHIVILKGLLILMKEMLNVLRKHYHQ